MLTSPHRLPSTDLRPLDDQLLVDIVSGIAEIPAAWRWLIRHDPARRHPVRLVATEAYEVWVIGWTQGQHVRPHNHGGSVAAVLVAEGELTELTLAGQRRTLSPGTVHRLGPEVVHDVVNRSEVPATSVHVYSPPLTTMTYYDPVTRAPAETVAIEHEMPVLSSWYGARLLHPSRPPSGLEPTPSAP